MRVRPHTAIAVLFGTILLSAVLAGDETSGSDEAERARRLVDMEAVVGDITLEKSQENAFVAVPAVDGARFRYNQPQIHCDDATVWLWADSGRPVALLTVGGTWPAADAAGSWSLEFSSLGESPLRARDSSQDLWSAAAGTLTFADIPDAPAPAHSGPLRLRQMKDLSRRFSAEGRYGGELKERFELRSLPTPIFTYRDPTLGIVDGALFVLADGTNPEAVLMIELTGDNQQSRWKYAFNRISSGQISGRLDGEEVWLSGPSYETGDRPDGAYHLVIRPMAGR